MTAKAVSKPLFSLKPADDVPVGTKIFQVFDRKPHAEDWVASLNGDRKRNPTAYITVRDLPAEYHNRGYFVILRDDEVWEKLVADLYGELQRSEKFKTTHAMKLNNIPVNQDEMERCWRSHLARLNATTKAKRQLPVQIDDGSADDI
jgi:hypothetical protein